MIWNPGPPRKHRLPSTSCRYSSSTWPEWQPPSHSPGQSSHSSRGEQTARAGPSPAPVSGSDSQAVGSHLSSPASTAASRMLPNHPTAVYHTPRCRDCLNSPKYKGLDSPRIQPWSIPASSLAGRNRIKQHRPPSVLKTIPTKACCNSLTLLSAASETNRSPGRCPSLSSWTSKRNRRHLADTQKG